METLTKSDLAEIGIAPVQVDYIKLMKMSKGFNWEIKLVGLDIDKLEQLNKEMMRRFEGE